MWLHFIGQLLLLQQLGTEIYQHLLLMKGKLSLIRNSFRLFSILIMICGVIWFGVGSGAISSVIQSFNQLDENLQRKYDILDNISQEFNLSRNYYKKLKDYLRYNVRKDNSEKYDFLELFPPKIKSELAQIMNNKTVSKFPVMKKNQDVMQNLIPLMKVVKVQKGDFIVEKGDNFPGFFFLEKGKAQMILSKSQQIPILTFEEGKIAAFKKI
jgi:hypothetical protein